MLNADSKRKFIKHMGSPSACGVALSYVRSHFVVVCPKAIATMRYIHLGVKSLLHQRFFRGSSRGEGVHRSRQALEVITHGGELFGKRFWDKEDLLAGMFGVVVCP
jgi:hypothetical protein